MPLMPVVFYQNICYTRTKSITYSALHGKCYVGVTRCMCCL